MTGSDDERGEERSRKRDRSGNDARLGFGIGAGIRALRNLFGGSTDGTGSRPRADDRRARRRRRSVSGGSVRREPGGRTRTKRIRVTGPDDPLVETRRADGAFVVTADVVGTDPSDLSVGIDRGANDLVIGTGGTVLERVGLPWRRVEATDVWLNNGVLEVRLRPRSE